jgi:hypothetical protein
MQSARKTGNASDVLELVVRILSLYTLVNEVKSKAITVPFSTKNQAPLPIDGLKLSLGFVAQNTATTLRADGAGC